MNTADRRLPLREHGPLGVDELLAALDPRRQHGCLVMDTRGDALRPAPDHLPDSAWVPWNEAGRTAAHLLPARGSTFVVVGERAASIAARLESEGWHPWWCDTPLPDGALQPGPPTGSLWAPDPLVERSLQLHTPPGIRVLDLGSGSGREAVYLAQAGYDVLAVDRLDDALRLLDQRAALVSAQVSTLHRRVRRPEELPRGPFDIVLMLRFLERDLLDELCHIVSPGGMAILRFYDAAKGDSPGPVRPRHRITAAELETRMGPEWTWKIATEGQTSGQDGWTTGLAIRKP